MDVRGLYDGFDLPVVAGVDCGTLCAPNNPSGKPFCCDICHAVPAVHLDEWAYLQTATDLWQPWRGDECAAAPDDAASLLETTPEHMRLLACKGPSACRRDFRTLSCRQFPFFPYVTADYRFIGLAYEWAFEATCWVISNLGRVSMAYRRAFIATFDRLFADDDDVFESYIVQSEEMRAAFHARRRRIPLLHRNGGFYLLSPGSDRLHRVEPDRLPRFGPYRQV